MLGRIFPKQFDNNFAGYKTAILFLVLIATAKTIQGVESVINTRSVVINADGIALDSFNPAGAATVLALFSLLGLNALVLPLQSVVVLARYRAMIPFMFMMFLTVQIASRALIWMNPIARTNGPPIGSTVNLVILVLTLVGFALSLGSPRRR